MLGQLKIMEDGLWFQKESCIQRQNNSVDFLTTVKCHFHLFLSLVFIITCLMVNSIEKKQLPLPESYCLWSIFCSFIWQGSPGFRGLPGSNGLPGEKVESSSRKKPKLLENPCEFEWKISDSVWCRFPCCELQHLVCRVLLVNVAAQVLLAPVDPQESVDKMEAQGFLEWE